MLNTALKEKHDEGDTAKYPFFHSPSYPVGECSLFSWAIFFGIHNTNISLIDKNCN
jgi:hypothetical protein